MKPIIATPTEQLHRNQASSPTLIAVSPAVQTSTATAPMEPMVATRQIQHQRQHKRLPQRRQLQHRQLRHRLSEMLNFSSNNANEIHVSYANRSNPDTIAPTPTAPTQRTEFSINTDDNISPTPIAETPTIPTPTSPTHPTPAATQTVLTPLF